VEWFKRSFGSDYLKVYAHRDAEEARQQIDFLEEKIHPAAGAKILDLCCGSGRHAIEMARRGYNVVGQDISQELLDIARRDADESGLALQFIEKDMREIPFKNEIDIVVNFFTSFGYFEDHNDDQAVLNAVSEALKAGGRLLLDHINPDFVCASLVRNETRTISGLEVCQERWIDEGRQRVEKRLTIIEEGKTRTYLESVKMYKREEIAVMLEKAGLRIGETYGDFSGARFSKDSPRMIVIAEKA